MMTIHQKSRHSDHTFACDKRAKSEFTVQKTCKFCNFQFEININQNILITTILITNMNEFLFYLIKQKSYGYFNFIFTHNFLVFQLIIKFLPNRN